MKTKAKGIIPYIAYLDLFQQNVSLKLQSKYRVSSLIGKNLSFAILLFMLYNFMFCDMIQKTNPIVLQQSLETLHRPKIIFSSSSMQLLFALIDFENNILPIDPSIFNFVVFQTNVKNGSKTFPVQKSTKNCSNEDFPRFPDIIHKMNLDHSSCLADPNFYVRGYWDEPELDFLRISLERCVNSSSSEVVCRSEEEIKSFLQDKYFSFWVEQTSFDMSNFDNPITSRIKNFYRGIEYGQTKIMRLFFKKTIIDSDEGNVYSSINEIESYTQGNLEFDSTISDIEFGRLMIYSSEIEQIFQRRYQKLFDLMASLGGVLNALILIGSFIVKYCHDWKMNEYILNKLFTFKKNKKKFFIPKINIGIIEHFKNHKIIIKEKEDNDHELKMSLSEKIKLFFKRKKNRNKKEQIYMTSINKCNEKIDIINILQKIEEIDKMKRVIFNDKQLLFFDSLDKMNLCSENDERKGYYKYSARYKDSIGAKSTVNNYIVDIKKERIRCNSVDKRLIKLIDE